MRFSEVDQGEFYRLIRDGKSDPELAAHYSVSSRTILRWRNRVEIESNWKPTLLPCGTYAAYMRGCRCPSCKAANTESHRASVAAMRSKGLASDDPRHGTYTAYSQWGCRCEACSTAGTERNREYYETHAGEISVPRWTSLEKLTVRSLPARLAIERLGRSSASVYAMRGRLGVTRKQNSRSGNGSD